MPSVVNCRFIFSADAHLGWARSTTAYCCGGQNQVPNQSPALVPDMNKAYYGISAFVPLNELRDNTFLRTVVPHGALPTMGLIEPAIGQQRTGNTFIGLD
jgi:hypothetical protein